MKFGLSDIYLEQIKSAVSSIPEIDEVVIYGSRARGDYSPTSDIDITLLMTVDNVISARTCTNRCLLLTTYRCLIDISKRLYCLH